MSLFFKEHGERYYPEFGEGRTKQSFKDSCDINKIIKKAQKTGSLAHLQKYPEAVYGEFDQETDLLTAHQRISRANEIFADLPSEIRREFNNDALKFVKWAGSLPPGELAQKIPELAQPGNYFPNPLKRGGKGAGLATAPTEPPQGGSSSEAASTDSPAAIERSETTEPVSEAD